MGWPLTGNNLSRFNRLLDDLRQYGDFPFLGSPDNVIWLWQTIREASNGQFSPELDDVANRSHYWMLRLVSFLGDQIVPPSPPVTEGGIIWGPDQSNLSLANKAFDSNTSGFFDDPQFTSLKFPTLVTIDDAGSGNSFEFRFGNTNVAVEFPELVSVNASSFNGDSNFGGFGITSLVAPKLKTVSGDIQFSDNDNLVSFDLSSLETIGGNFIVTNSAALTVFSVPSLVTVALIILVNNSPNLTTLNFPLWLPTDGTGIDFTGNALTAASVNHLLARGVANPAFVSGTLDLSGQTPAQPPTGQGIADAATLTGRGVTVITD